MLALDTVNKSLEVKLAGAVATTELPWIASYVDIDQATLAMVASSETDGPTNGGTAVVVAAAPGAATTRKLNYFSLVNIDTAAATATVQVNNTGTKRISVTVILAVGDQLTFTDSSGWVITDKNGQHKVGSTTVSLTAGVTGILPGANGGTGVNNGAYLVTVGGNVSFSGAFATILRVTAATDVTLPTTGTLVNTAVTSLPSLAGVGTITTGVWNAGAVTTTGLTVNAIATAAQVTGGTNGQVALFVTNTTSGTLSYAEVHLTAGTNAMLIQAYSQGFSSTGASIQDGCLFYATGAGGMGFAAAHASGTIQFRTGGVILRAQINTNGTQTWAPYGAGAATFDASGNITSVSDERFKDRIAPLSYGLAEVLQLWPVQHGYNELSGLEREHLYGGFIAQQVQPVMPLAIGVDQRGYLTLADRPILGAVVNAIKTHESRLKALEEARIH